MNRLYDNTDIFILRIWKEPGVPQGKDPLHRIAIEIVKTGEKYYLKDVAEIGDFISDFLEKSGTTMGMNYPRRIWREIKHFLIGKYG